MFIILLAYIVLSKMTIPFLLSGFSRAMSLFFFNFFNIRKVLIAFCEG